MPYTGPDDSSLPENVKELDKDLRALWVEVWNRTYSDCTSSSAEQDDCEARAFKYANGVVLKSASDIAAHSAALANYRGAIRSAVTGFWSGAIDYDQFWDTMYTAIDAGLSRAWYDGAKECGILPAELSPDERAALRRVQVQELNHVGNLAQRIEQGSKANGGKLAPLLAHADLWIRRAQDVMNQARVMACADQKLMWVLGRTEQHCSSCAKLHGKVKRASYWQRVGVLPQNPPNNQLECGGWLCDCSLVPTDEPLSKGPLPSLP